MGTRVALVSVIMFAVAPTGTGSALRTCSAALAREPRAQQCAAHSQRGSALKLCRLAALLAGLAVLSPSDRAQAADWSGEGPDAPEPPAAATTKSERSGWLPSAALHTPLSLGILSEDDVDQAALLLTGLDLDLSLGRAIGQSSRLALEIAFGLRSTLGVVDRFDLQPYDPELPATIEGTLSYVLPLGLCVDWLPSDGSGWFGSLHAGAGVFNEPDYMTSGNLELAGRLAGDLGWVIPLDTGRLALSARYSLLGLQRVYIDEDYESALQLHELSFGVAWHR